MHTSARAIKNADHEPAFCRSRWFWPVTLTLLLLDLTVIYYLLH